MSRAVFALVLLLGCRSAAGPVSEPATETETHAMYVLRTVAGEPLPAAIVENEHVRLLAVADTIWIGEGVGRQASVQRVFEETSPAEGEVFRSEAAFTYDLSGDRITVDLECRDVIIRSCIAPPHYTGTITSSSMVLQSALQYRVPLRYERVRIPS